MKVTFIGPKAQFHAWGESFEKGVPTDVGAAVKAQALAHPWFEDGDIEDAEVVDKPKRGRPAKVSDADAE